MAPCVTPGKPSLKKPRGTAKTSTRAAVIATRAGRTGTSSNLRAAIVGHRLEDERSAASRAILKRAASGRANSSTRAASLAVFLSWRKLSTSSWQREQRSRCHATRRSLEPRNSSPANSGIRVRNLPQSLMYFIPDREPARSRKFLHIPRRQGQEPEDGTPVLPFVPTV